LEYLTEIAVDFDILKLGLKSKHKDYEESIQICCAASVQNIDCIITRNTKDFRESEIPAYNPNEIW
jgi:hypothetical protein